MAHKRKDSLVSPSEWWRHLRPFNKRLVSKAERRAAKAEIDGEILVPDDTPKGLGLHNDPKKMRFLRSHAGGGESLVPGGIYCYDDTGNRPFGNCPFWDVAENKPKQENGFCWLMGKGDWDEGVGELWNACKCCGLHEAEAPEGTLEVLDEKAVKRLRKLKDAAERGVSIVCHNGFEARFYREAYVRFHAGVIDIEAVEVPRKLLK